MLSMKWSAALFVAALCQGVFGSDDCSLTPFEFCRDKQVDMPRSAEELIQICPKLKLRIGCLGTYDATCPNKKFYIPGQFESVVSLLDDVCDNGSLLHSVAMANFDCIIQTVESIHRDCFSKALDFQESYEKSHEDLSEDGVETRCVREVAEISCSLKGIAEQCNVFAKDALLEIVDRTFIFRQRCPGTTLAVINDNIDAVPGDNEVKVDLKKLLDRIRWH